VQKSSAGGPGGFGRFTPEEVIGLLRLGKVTELSLDHDLGLPATHGERTGYTVLLWLEAEVGTGRWTDPLPQISIHGGNPVGPNRMLRVSPDNPPAPRDGGEGRREPLIQIGLVAFARHHGISLFTPHL
jgi:hypothetical protein